MAKIFPKDFSSFLSQHAPLFQGRRISVYQMEAKSQEGDTHLYDWVYHPGAVTILPFLDEETILLIANDRIAVGKTLLELPAGTLEENENPLTTAQRELVEETGYRADQLDHLFDFFSSPGFCNEVLFSFTAKGLHFEGQQLDPTEKITVVPMPLKKAIQGIQEGIIQDAKSIATLLYYFTFGTSR